MLNLKVYICYCLKPKKWMLCSIYQQLMSMLNINSVLELQRWCVYLMRLVVWFLQDVTKYTVFIVKLNSLQHLSNRVSMYVHAYTLYGSVRPFGVSCLIGSYDAAVGPQMYCIDPSGVSFVSLVIILLKCSLKYRCKFYNWFSSCALTIFSNSGSFRIWHKFDLMVFCFIRVKPW